LIYAWPATTVGSKTSSWHFEPPIELEYVSDDDPTCRILITKRTYCNWLPGMLCHTEHKSWRLSCTYNYYAQRSSATHPTKSAYFNNPAIRPLHQPCREVRQQQTQDDPEPTVTQAQTNAVSKRGRPIGSENKQKEEGATNKALRNWTLLPIFYFLSILRSLICHFVCCANSEIFFTNNKFRKFFLTFFFWFLAPRLFLKFLYLTAASVHERTTSRKFYNKKIIFLFFFFIKK